MGIGRSNIVIYNSNSPGSGGSGTGGNSGVTTVDVPQYPASLSSSIGNQYVQLNISYTDTTYVSGVLVVYKTDSYPTSPTDGNTMITPEAVTSVKITGLTNTVKYYFRVYLYREIDGVKYYQTNSTNSTITATPCILTIEGIDPAIIGDNYVVIDKSGSFTISAPEYPVSLTAYVVGGGMDGYDGSDGYTDVDDDGTYHYLGSPGSGGLGARKNKYTLELSKSTSCTLTIGASATGGGSILLTNSKFVFNSVSYSPSSSTYTSYNKKGIDGLLTPYGYVGSSGGTGGSSTKGVYSSSICDGYSGGIGAGNGGEGARSRSVDAKSGTSATTYGSGGGGGGAGGEGGDWNESGGSGGSGKDGCLIIEWS